MRTLLAGLVVLVVATWGVDLSAVGSPAGGSLPWAMRQEGLYVSGLLSMAMMSLAMFLAARPAWLEGPLGGLDRMYRTHKWAGILAIGFAALHWLIEMSDDILKVIVGRAGRIPKENYTGFLEVLRDLAEDMGEWAIYALLVMLAITLWKRFPYRAWRFLHRAMPIIYLTLAFHAALLAPADYWTRPVGALLALWLGAGVYGSVMALAGRIGRSRRVSGTITAIEHPSHDVIAVRCRLNGDWRVHRPGQFAFITFDTMEGAHPFTIASADRGDRTIDFQIKALGDYTGRLAVRLSLGQEVRVEGPYGRFDITRLDRKARQIWIAGGIGITPFLAWLESLQARPEQAHADLHYWTRTPDIDPFVTKLESLCAPLPGMRLHVHGSHPSDVLTATKLMMAVVVGRRTEFWFCGPQGLAGRVKQELNAMGLSRLHFHQEAFEMR